MDLIPKSISRSVLIKVQTQFLTNSLSQIVPSLTSKTRLSVVLIEKSQTFGGSYRKESQRKRTLNLKKTRRRNRKFQKIQNRRRELIGEDS